MLPYYEGRGSALEITADGMRVYYADEQRWAAFSRRLDDEVVELAPTTDGLLDTRSGTVFSPLTGVGMSGPLADQSLDKLGAFTSFPKDFVTFFPDGKLWP